MNNRVTDFVTQPQITATRDPSRSVPNLTQVGCPRSCGSGVVEQTSKTRFQLRKPNIFYIIGNKKEICKF